MLFGKSKTKGMCGFCSWTSLVIGVFAILSSLAALIGVYQSHFLSTGVAFGTTSGSLSLLALAVNIFLVKKASAACPCQCSVPSKK